MLGRHTKSTYWIRGGTYQFMPSRAEPSGAIIFLASDEKNLALGIDSCSLPWLRHHAMDGLLTGFSYILRPIASFGIKKRMKMLLRLGS